MRNRLTKGAIHRPVIKKGPAAIFLLMTIMFIGSVSQTVLATEVQQVKTDETIAATTTPLLVKPDTVAVSATDILEIPKQVHDNVPQIITNMPSLVQDSTLAAIVRKPEEEPLHIDRDVSRIPAITGMITSNFGWRIHPVRGKKRFHNGLDIAAKMGQNVVAPASGKIVFAGWKTGYGNVIEIDHENGYTSLLAHHSKLLVKTGDMVTAATVIAKAGRTGVATGVHIHFEVRKSGELVNPIKFLLTK